MLVFGSVADKKEELFSGVVLCVDSRVLCVCVFHGHDSTRDHTNVLITPILEKVIRGV